MNKILYIVSVLALTNMANLVAMNPGKPTRSLPTSPITIRAAGQKKQPYFDESTSRFDAIVSPEAMPLLLEILKPILGTESDSEETSLSEFALLSSTESADLDTSDSEESSDDELEQEDQYEYSLLWEGPSNLFVTIKDENGTTLINRKKVAAGERINGTSTHQTIIVVLETAKTSTKYILQPGSYNGLYTANGIVVQPEYFTI
jgi:hypothetical protein